MPRSGVNGTYSLPPNTNNQAPNTPISSSMFNAFASDVQQTFNDPTPEAYGGTGASTFAGARANLGVVTEQVGGMASRRNRIVNGDMRVSQENGTASGTSTGYYPVDQWAQYRVTSAGVLTVEQVASVTPAGSPSRLRATVTTADASLAAGEYWTLTQNLEGSNVADFQYGSASAKDAVLRFGFRGPAGTYAVHLGNSAANRSFVALFTIGAGDANTETVQEIAIPGDTTGTWLTADGVIGITLDIVLACGSTFQGSAGWQSGNILGTSTVSNGMAVQGAVFELFDVGLKLDPDATGVYGQYEVGEVDAVYRNERYWYAVFARGTINYGYTISAETTSRGRYWSWDFRTKMAKTPAAASSLVLSSSSIGTVDASDSGVVANSGLVAQSALVFISSGFISLNARLS